MNNIVYRTNEFFKRDYKKFSPLVPDYRLDEKEKKIVKVGMIDFQEKIQSSVDCDYRKVFDKFINNEAFSMPLSLFGDVLIDEAVFENSDDIFIDKLTANMQLFEKSNEYINAFNLDPNLTPSEVFKKVSEIAQKLKVDNDKFIELLNKKFENKAIEKGGSEDETQKTNETS